MAHEFARALQQLFRIGKFGAAEETHVDVSVESVDLPEGRITDTGGRVAVVQ